MDWLQTDTDGIWHIGKATRGCKHCGKTETHYATNGKAAWHHPGTNCCRAALADQHRWRVNDLNQARQTYKTAEQRVYDLEDKTSRASGAERNALQIEANKARAALPFKRDRLLLDVDGDPTNDIVGLKNEIAELEDKLRQWDAHTNNQNGARNG